MLTLHCRLRRYTKGFTLVELLAVNALIVMSASLLIPVFQKARESAHRAACLSNQKQLSVALTQYAQDYNELYPMAISGSGGPAHPGLYDRPYSTQKTWAAQLYPYIKSKGAYVCPDDRYSTAYQDFALDKDIIRSYTVVQMFHGTKGVNSAVISDGVIPSAVSEVPEPSQTVWLTEAGKNVNYDTGLCYDTPCRNMNINTLGFYVNDRANYLPDGSSPLAIAQYHNSGTDWAFADGHVKWIKLEQTINIEDTSKDLWCRNKS